MKKYSKIFILIICLFLSISYVKADCTEVIQTCENPEILKVIQFILLIFDVVKVVVPIALIIIGMHDFSKGVTTNDESISKKKLQLFIKRVIYAILIFAVPWIVEVLMINIGNLTEEVNFTDCLENANKERISELQITYDELKEKEKQCMLDSKEKNKTEDNRNVNHSSGDNTSDKSEIKYNDEVKVKIKYDDAIVENIAAFVGSESGAFSEGFEGQLMTAAVFINNMYYPYYDGKDPITSPSDITLDNMCKTFKYGTLYSTDYCNLTFEKVSKNRGTFTNAQKNQLNVVAKLVLSGTFTIPKQVNGQGNLSNWGSVGKEWGTTTTHIGCVIDKNADTNCAQVFAYSKYYPITDEDVYGNKVSTNFSDYKSIAGTLYQKYVVEGKKIF